MAISEDIKKQIDDLSVDVVGLKVEAARQSEQIKGLGSKLNEVHDGVKSIRNSLFAEVKGSNRVLKSWVFKLLIIVVTSGIGGAAVSTAVNAMSESPVKVEPLVP